MRHPSYLIVQPPKNNENKSPTRPEIDNAAKLLSWEYRTSHEQHLIYTTVHEDNHRNARMWSHNLLVVIATTRYKPLQKTPL